LTGDNKEFLIGFMEFEVSGKTDHDMVSIMIDGVQ
jgi:hypothetical protein